MTYTIAFVVSGAWFLTSVVLMVSAEPFEKWALSLALGGIWLLIADAAGRHK